jgi:hypothetical protein
MIQKRVMRAAQVVTAVRGTRAHYLCRHVHSPQMGRTSSPADAQQSTRNVPSTGGQSYRWDKRDSNTKHAVMPRGRRGRAQSECSGELEPGAPKKNAGKCMSSTWCSIVRFASDVMSRKLLRKYLAHGRSLACSGARSDQHPSPLQQ